MDEKNKGIILIILSSLFFALMATTVKFAEGYSLAEKVFFRNFIGLLVMTYSIYQQKISFKPNNLKLLTLRSLLGLSGVYLYFITLGHLDLSLAVTLNKTSPFFVMIFAVIFLNEKLTRYKLVSLIVAIGGVIIIMRPSAAFDPVYGIVALCAAVVAGGAYTVVRMLKDYDHPLVVIFYFCLYSVLITGPIALKSGMHITSFKDIGILTLIGLFAVIAQTLMTFAYRYAPASELAIYSYMNIVFSFIIGVVLFHESLAIINAVGVMLIILAGYINYLGQMKNLHKISKA
ncbi:MAG: DMT family transporter [Clostridia bacterium]|nr:DMT family transporter [Clostridia bacterium]